MRADPYRRVLDVPGIRTLYGLALVARIPVTAVPTALTLRVVLGLHRGFAESGLVVAASAIGTAVGAPLLGRLVDRRGPRAVLAVTTVCQAGFWTAAALLPYAWFVPAAFVGGVLSLPVFQLARQSIASLLPLEDRQAGMSLDSMSIEVAFSIGPAAGVIAVTRLGSSVAMLVIGASMVAAGVALMILNPPIETGVTPAAEHGERSAATTSRSPFTTPVAVATLVATACATFTLSGNDSAVAAAMRAFGHIGLLGVVIAVACLASLIGGFVYGMLSRRHNPLVLLLFLATCSVLPFLAQSWWVLLILVIPAALFCAPLLSATAEVMSRVAPPAQRGRALGVHTSALTIGNAAGAPVAGIAIDRWSPAAGFATIGAAGAAMAVVALALTGVQKRRAAKAAEAPITYLPSQRSATNGASHA